jgi:hypothetical protein
MRLSSLVCALLLLQATAASAEWQLKPFMGVTFGGTYTFIDLDQVAGERNFVVGGSATWLVDFIGVEVDFGRVPGFFQTESQQLVLSSSVTTLTGNIVLTLPKKMARYTLRPYVVAGGGLVRAAYDDELGVLSNTRSLGTLDFGGGATGFVNDRVALNWDLRYYRSLGGTEGSGLSIGRERISFWRATMGVAIRVGSGQ